MELNDRESNAPSYYGRLGAVAERPLSDDIVNEQELSLMEYLREMESRIKRHITECKRDVILEITRNKKNNFNSPKEKVSWK